MFEEPDHTEASSEVNDEPSPQSWSVISNHSAAFVSGTNNMGPVLHHEISSVERRGELDFSMPPTSNYAITPTLDLPEQIPCQPQRQTIIPAEASQPSIGIGRQFWRLIVPRPSDQSTLPSSTSSSIDPVEPTHLARPKQRRSRQQNARSSKPKADHICQTCGRKEGSSGKLRYVARAARPFSTG